MQVRVLGRPDAILVKEGFGDWVFLSVAGHDVLLYNREFGLGMMRFEPILSSSLYTPLQNIIDVHYLVPAYY